MDYYHFQSSQSQNHHSTKPSCKKRLTQQQARILEASFSASHKLLAERKQQLSLALGLPPRQVAIWYQNRRTRQKSETVVHDYKTIQLQLENVLQENKKLEKEVSTLKQQLHKVQQMLVLASNPSAIHFASLSSSGDDEQMSSSSPSNMNCSWGSAGLWEAQQLQARHDLFP